jgi:HlyD family type I secretion membrane fusion protein
MPSVPSLFRRPGRELDLLSGPISAFESETQAVFVRTTPYSDHAILHVLVGIFVVTILLMSVIKLDRVVTSAGKLVPTGGTLYVGPLDRAIVRAIKVHPGDVVKKGQVLAELDPTFAQADVKQQQDHAAAVSALVARLEAELAGTPYEPGPTQPEQLQASIWHQRQSELQQTLADFDARIHSDEALVTKAQQDISAYSQRLSYAAQVENMETTLEKNGNASKLKVLEASDAKAEAARQVSEARNTLNGGQHDLDALKAQRAVALGKWRDDIGTQLAAARDDLHQTQQALAKANRVSDLITVQAPEDAVVLEIGNASTGSVIDTNTSAVKPLFTLVPLGGNVEADIEVASKDIGFIKVGDTVQIKLDAYPFMRHGTAKGVITTISEGSFTQSDNQARAPFFKARVRLEDTTLRNVPDNFRLIPGMTIQGDVLVGHRTIMSYLIEGALRTGSEAMREP